MWLLSYKYFKGQVFYFTQNPKTDSFEIDSFSINGNPWTTHLPDTQTYIKEQVGAAIPGGDSITILDIGTNNFDGSTTNSPAFGFDYSTYEISYNEDPYTVTIDDTIHEHVVVFTTLTNLSYTYIDLPCTLEYLSRDIDYELWIKDDSDVGWFSFEGFSDVTSDSTTYTQNVDSFKSFLKVTVEVNETDDNLSPGGVYKSTLITLNAEF